MRSSPAGSIAPRTRKASLSRDCENCENAARQAETRCSMNLRIGRRHVGPAVQEIEIAALISLRHAVLVERAEAARIMRRRPLPRCAPCRELRLAHFQLDLAPGDIELDQIA